MDRFEKFPFDFTFYFNIFSILVVNLPYFFKDWLKFPSNNSLKYFLWIKIKSSHVTWKVEFNNIPEQKRSFGWHGRAGFNAEIDKYFFISTKHR